MADRGEPDEHLASALAQDLETAAGRAGVLAALLDARVFAAITATPTGLERASPTGLERASPTALEQATPTALVAEAGAELAVVLLATHDGSRALPLFSNLLALRAWRVDVRPVPLTGQQACAAALEQGAEAVVLDPGSSTFALLPAEVQALAAGWLPVPGSSLASRRTTQQWVTAADASDALLVALRDAVAPERLRAARLLDGPDGPVLGVAPRSSLPPAALAALAARVRNRLGQALPLAGLDLAVVPVDGAGVDLLAGGWFRRRGR